MKCEICNTEMKNLSGLGCHIKRIHKMETVDYYVKYLNHGLIGKCTECGKETTFRGLKLGFQKFCGLKCSAGNADRKRMFRESYLKNDMKTVRAKRENTNLERWGDKCANNIKEVQDKNMFTQRKRNFGRAKEFLKLFDVEILGEYVNNETPILCKCSKCNKEFEETYANIQQRTYKCHCTWKKEKNRSIGEKDLLKFIQKISPNVKTNERLNGYELDIFDEGRKIAIEYCGVYWHSEKRRKDPENCHNNKLKLCDDNGIRLIQIFEDEWIEHKDIVQKRLSHIMGTTLGKRIHARSCEIKVISCDDKNNFLDKYHIQGKDISLIRLGAFYKEELVAVMTFSRGSLSKGHKVKEGVWELNRFCNNYDYNIPGIASKLLTYFKRNYEWKEIFSYADRRWSNGNVYEKIGFNLDSITKPNYWYSDDGYRRIHRFVLRKRADEPKDVPEYMLRAQEGYYRIWDCGNFKFVMRNENIDRTK